MRFDEIDTKMRVYETAHDRWVLPGMQIVAQLDGRSFTRLTKEVYAFERPFDATFRDAMLATVEHQMACGFNVVYGYTQSDEISLLFAPNEIAFERKVRKFLSILAGEASAKFSLTLGGLGTFDCRLSELPSLDLVVDYFRWRAEDAFRNALNAHCYWTLRADGESPRRASTHLRGMSFPAKHELLFQHGINFNDLPAWQKRGSGMYWESFIKESVNPQTGEPSTAQRRRITRNLDLPVGDTYGDFIRGIAHEQTLVN